MAFEGALEDLAIVDVLQLLHVSQKTGILRVFCQETQANIVLKNGHIVGCRHPSSSRNIGEELIGMGVVTQADVQQAAMQQKEAGEQRRPMMATLIDMGRLEKEAGWKALEGLIESTVVELVAWRTGRFVFEMGEIASFDEFAHIPRGVDTQLSVDTQSALMEAVRILDERNRAKQEVPVTANEQMDFDQAPTTIRMEDAAQAFAAAKKREPTQSPQQLEDITQTSPGMMKAPWEREQGDELDNIIGERLGSSWRAQAPRRVVLFSDDGLLKMSLRPVCAKHQIDLFVTQVEKDAFDRIATWHDGMVSPLLICDMAAKPKGASWQRQCLRTLSRCRKEHVDVPIVLLGEPEIESFSMGFAKGATAVLPRPRSDLSRSKYVEDMRKLYAALIACIQATFERRSVLLHRLSESRKRMSTLKERIEEVRSPDGPSQVSLVVLRHVAEYVERCVLFLVRKNDLLALGAFGLDDHAETVSSVITHLRMPLSKGSLVTAAVQSGRFYCGANEDSLIQSHLYSRIGTPVNSEIVLVPLKTKEKTAALIYGDFGDQAADLIDTDSLEILANHAGMAFELALADKLIREGAPGVDQRISS